MQKPTNKKYSYKQIGWELERTALCDGFYGNALRVAKDLPGITSEERALLDRFSSGAQVGGADGWDLQRLSKKIYFMVETT